MIQLYDRAKTNAAWTIFWQEQVDGGRCLEVAHPQTTQVLLNHWSSFSALLPPQARVLDIGCGAGAVARWLVSARSDLRVTGVDIANVPLSADSRIELLSHTSMEALPFPDASFGAAVSQFGFEYGRTGEASKELARVLAPQARFSFLVHHAAGSIVARSRARLRALNTLLGRQMGGAFVFGDAPSLHAQISFLMRDFPDDTLITEIATHLPTRLDRDRDEKFGMWKNLESALAPECRILEALNECCVASDEIEDWLLPLAHFFELKKTSISRKNGGQPIVWRIDGIRKQVACRS